MRQSQLFSKTNKTAPKDDVSINAKLLEQAGFVYKNMAGVYTFLPLGQRVLQKIEGIIREEMNALGAQEVLMPALHPKEVWEQTGRWQSLDILFKVKSQHGYEAALGPTHEEIVTPVASHIIQSYQDLPLAVYQLQTKFRDEPRAKSGLLRGREFRMKDLYSFHVDEADLVRYYEVVAEAYRSIFKRLDLDAKYTEASGGSFSKYSHEFQVEIESGEDTIYVCGGCQLAQNKEIYTSDSTCSKCGAQDFREAKASEVGNIFQLKTRFSEAFNLSYTDGQGERSLVYMGCYGMGPSRIMGVLVEKYHDEAGILWPTSVAPFQVHLIALPGKEGKDILVAADQLYSELTKSGHGVLYDDRSDKSAGEKFADSDLIGIPHRVVVSAKTLADGECEVKPRGSDQAKRIKLVSLTNYFKGAPDV